MASSATKLARTVGSRAVSAEVDDPLDVRKFALRQANKSE
jgi:hypothetical protein